MRPIASILLLLTACGSGATTSTTTSSSTGAAAIWSGSPCASCDAQACSDEQTTCAAEPQCASYLDCEGMCPLGASGDADATCDMACRAPVVDPSAVAALSLLGTCRLNGPGSMCAACGRMTGAGGAGGGGSTCTPPAILDQQCTKSNQPDPCQACQFDHCCDSVNAAFNDNGPTQALTTCWLACSTPACQAACFAQYPAGVAGFGGYEACLFDRCFVDGACKQSKADKCGACQYESCGCEQANCLADSECFLARECFSTSQCVAGDINCAKACIAKHPTAKPLLDALEVCMSERCINSCTGN